MSLKLSTGFRNSLLKAGGSSAVDLMAKGYFEIRDGSQPATADAAEIGNLLARITVDAGSYTDLTTYGIDAEASGVTLIKPAGVNWQGEIILAGRAGWWRWYANDGTHGASIVVPRIDGAISSTGGQMKLSTIDLKLGATLSIDSMLITFPTA